PTGTSSLSGDARRAPWGDVGRSVQQEEASMSVRTDPSMTGSSAPPAAYEDETRGYGWVIFSGTMLAILGTVNIIAGIGAIDDSKFYVHGAKYVFGDLNTWGWIVLITGSAQLLTAFGVWARSNVATWAGVLFAGLNS